MCSAPRGRTTDASSLRGVRAITVAERIGTPRLRISRRCRIIPSRHLVDAFQRDSSCGIRAHTRIHARLCLRPI